jgi:hypothetical protein
MLRVKAVSERQVLIEEIYDELEGLLLGARGASVDEEEDEPDVVETPKSGQKGPESQITAARRTGGSRSKKDFSGLLTALLKIQSQMQRGLESLCKLQEQQS